MSVSGIGSTYSYIYNSQTKKLSTKDENQDEFVKYFNGDIDGSSTEELNGFDANKKRDIENMIMLFEQAGLAKDVIAGSTEIEISGEIVDADTSIYSVNGKKVFTANSAISYMPSEISMFTDGGQPFKTRQSKGYNVEDNSINIAVGDVMDLDNGYTLVVKDNHVMVKRLGNGNSEDDDKARLLALDLTRLIHFADQQGMASTIREESTPMLLALLEEMGVDTSKEFIINETKCEVKNGRIKEVGNTHVVPSSIYNAALKRYEELCYQPLSSLT